MAQTKLRNTQIEEGGWTRLQSTLTFNSVDNPTGVVNMADANTILSLGMRVKFNNGGNTIYGIVTAVTSSTFTFLHEINPANNQALHLLQNSAITDVYYSCHKAPLGFPMSPAKWTVEFTSSDTQTQSAPTNGTWYNIGATSLNIPIGAWNLAYFVNVSIVMASSTTIAPYISLSDSNNSESDHDFTMYCRQDSLTRHYFSVSIDKDIILTSKTTYYIIAKVGTTTASISYEGANGGTTKIRAICSYL